MIYDFTPAILESPYKGDIHTHKIYAYYCMKDMIFNHNESPYASHILYTQEKILNDSIPDERELGIKAGFAFKNICNKTVVYTDLGISDGMQLGIKEAEDKNNIIEYRELPKQFYDDFLLDSMGF